MPTLARLHRCRRPRTPCVSTSIIITVAARNAFIQAKEMLLDTEPELRRERIGPTTDLSALDNQESNHKTARALHETILRERFCKPSFNSDVWNESGESPLDTSPPRTKELARGLTLFSPSMPKPVSSDSHIGPSVRTLVPTHAPLTFVPIGDSVMERNDDGRVLKILLLVDKYSRTCLALRVARRLRSNDVIDVLAETMIAHGVLAYIRSD